ncbi:MAG: porphobilinogen synthase [Bdellovibrionaceae bacterium]|nr:porphobilinogen synthase [Pseudobdellovibrionaceae bacterium]
MKSLHRPRRLRSTTNIRELSHEISYPGMERLIYPCFIQSGSQKMDPILAMPGQFRYSMDIFLKKLTDWKKLGIKNIALFPKIDENLKNSESSEALNENGFLPKALQQIKERHPEIAIFTDLALDPFSSDGHDGLVANGKILNDETVAVLAEMAVIHARNGADFVCPSDMMDGRVKKIREALEQSRYIDTGIVSYSAKYASSFYGPFREALDSAPRAGDKKTYQMDFRNQKEALKEAKLDFLEGADVLMVKPALSYLDVISKVKEKSILPVAAYNVSGEYAMVKASAEKGWIDGKKAILEILTSIHRAGADMIFTYHAPEYAEIMQKELK